MTADVIIVGGGAAGLVAAIVAARRGRKVVMLEAGERVGKKLLASGNGKCNLANRTLTARDYNSPFASSAVARVKETAIEAFFEDMGLPLRADETGRVYPYAELSSCVLNVLREEAEKRGVAIKTETPVKTLLETKNGWRAAGESGESVIWASGSAATFGLDSLEVLRGLGIITRPFRPSLVPLLADVSDLSGLRGVKFKASAELLSADGGSIAKEYGEILVKDNGLSGIAIFNLSAAIARRAQDSYTLAIDFFPEMSEQRLASFLSKSTSGAMHKELLRNAVRRIGSGESNLLAELLKNYRLEVKGLSHFSLAQASSGGVAAEELDDSMQARAHKGLYVVGEAVDVDGLCGGYNLMWAWASAMLAGAQA